MRHIADRLYRFSSSWTGTIIIVLVLIFFVAQSFLIPSGSMKQTLLVGDFLFGKKFSYGIPTPRLPWLNTPLLPDFNRNGHLIEGDRPKRGDIVIFLYPRDHATHYVKRCVAVGGDEILYINRHLMIHLHEGDAYMRDHYPKTKLVRYLDKLWAINPYRDDYPGIQYRPQHHNAFELLLAYKRVGEPIDMEPILLREATQFPVYSLNGNSVNAFYTKVPQDHYYMMGDNRDNSNDSRFWGPVPYRLIIAKPWFVWMSVEFRSYERVAGLADANHNGQDHQALSRVCGTLPLESDACRKAWNRQRFRVRWNRLGRMVDTLEHEQPILD